MITSILLQYSDNNSVDDAGAAFFWGGIIILTIIVAVALLLSLIVMIFYLRTLQNTLKEISSENKKIHPKHVWLILIPVFGIVWSFVVISGIADSLKAEFEKRGITVNEERPGYQIGLTYCVLFCCAFLPIIRSLSALGSLICFIIYWVKIHGYKKQLQRSKVLS